jgi:hypothetical protein
VLRSISEFLATNTYCAFKSADEVASGEAEEVLPADLLAVSVEVGPLIP